jgi:Bacterial regulatory proteins, tetR family
VRTIKPPPLFGSRFKVPFPPATRSAAPSSPWRFTLDDVADTLGVTKPAIYHYFPNREALMRGAVAEGQLEHGRVLLKAARDAENGPAVLHFMTPLDQHCSSQLLSCRNIM